MTAQGLDPFALLHREAQNRRLGRGKAGRLASLIDLVTHHGDLGNASALLDGVAGMGLEQMKAAFSDVGKACSACHKDFRAK